jgi:hypothetical protein
MTKTIEAKVNILENVKAFDKAEKDLKAFKEKNKAVFDELKGLEKALDKPKDALKGFLEAKNVDGLDVYTYKREGLELTLTKTFVPSQDFDSEGNPGSFRRYLTVKASLPAFATKR